MPKRNFSPFSDAEENELSSLDAAGINSVDRLLQRGGTSRGRKELESLTGISEDTLLRWIQELDLSRIPNLRPEQINLLEAAGINHVMTLSESNPEKLHQLLLEANNRRNIVDEVPQVSEVENWIREAKALPERRVDEMAEQVL